MTPVTSLQKCPACGEESRYLLDWEFSGVDKSVFNYTAKYYSCAHCGLVYIENISDERLSHFYFKECTYFEKPHFDISSLANVAKYAAYRDFIVSLGLDGVSITDVGCGRGGFLMWLNKNGWQADCYGVDVDIKSIPEMRSDCAIGDRQNVRVSFEQGTATKLPFSDLTQSLLTYFHVLEHIRNVDDVLSEAFRVLKDGGHIVIEVPDAENYQQREIGTAFWIGIREHIHHFSACSLVNALHRHGFDVVKVRRCMLPTPEFIYPSLMAVAIKRDGPTGFKRCEKGNVATFVKKSKRALQMQARYIGEISARHIRMTFWGCSAELFSLLPIVKLRNVTLCDSNKRLQQCHYKNIPIQDPKKVEQAGALIVAPYLHGEVIEKKARELGWAPEAIYRLK